VKLNKIVLLLVYTLAGLIAASAPLRAQRLQALGAKTILSGTVPRWLNRATRLGPADENRRVVIEAYLGWRNQSELEQLIKEQATPGDARYGQFLTPEQFHATFSPRAEDVALVQRTLSAIGLNIKYTPASGLFVEASGTVGQIKQAFGVSQNLYSYRGKILRAHAEEPSLPAQLSGLVTYIDGLDDTRPLMKPALARPLRAGMQPSSTTGIIPPPVGANNLYPCANYWDDHQALLESPSPFPYGPDLPWQICGYTPQQVRAAYGANQVSETGRNVRVAIADLYVSSTLMADVNRYSANHGLPQLTSQNFAEILQPGVNYIPTGDPCGSQGWLGEETLDVTAVHSMAPNAFILYVGGSCDQVDVVDEGEGEQPLYQVIDQKLADIITNSWTYIGEGDVSSARLAIDTFQLLQAAAEGITVLFASGDDGDSTQGAPPVIPVASGSWPATSPYATAVGGTSLLLMNASGEKAEYGWANYLTTFNGTPVVNAKATKVTDQGWGAFEYAGGSGGGPSLIIPEPFYQSNVVPNIFATQTYTAAGAPVPLNGPHRVTPDIAMVADPDTALMEGQTLIIGTPPVDPGCTKTSLITEYCESPIGGTSLATPLFAGVLALVNERRFSEGLSAVGFVNPALYALHVGGTGANAPIVDVNAPSEPIGVLVFYPGFSFYGFATLDSNPTSNGNIVENVDSSLRSVPGYDNVTGLGAPWVPALLQALGGRGE
jgi:subtilase family serine protease